MGAFCENFVPRLRTPRRIVSLCDLRLERFACDKGIAHFARMDLAMREIQAFDACGILEINFFKIHPKYVRRRG